MIKYLKTFLIFILILLTSGCGIFSTVSSNDGSAVITPELTKTYISFLASDSLKGRDTPSPGLDTAASYIAQVFKGYGISPVKGSYFQNVHMGFVSLGDDNFLKINTPAGIKAYKIKSAFTPFEMTGNTEAKAAIVFAGYGIEAPEYNYNDYENIDVKGKIVLVLRHEPGENDTASAFKGTEATKYSNVAEKVKTAVEHGAAAVLVCQGPLNHTFLTPRGFPWPSLSKIIPKDALPLTLLQDEKDKVPVVQVGKEVIAALFGSVDKLKSLQAGIDKTMKPNSFLIDGAEADLKTSTIIKQEPSRNVVGIIEGSDPVLKNEFVVLGAHYDHVGYKKEHKPDEDFIFNGADDNASGTTALMAAAAAFASSDLKPRRSVLFIAFCGEEKGLFGSRYYAENPLFPLSKTVCMLNMDMVGRNSIDSLQILGYSSCPELVPVVEEANKNIGFYLRFDEKISGGSDHQSFIGKNVPALFFHSGLESEYHTVRDKVSLINFEKIAKTAKLVYNTARLIADGDQVYRFHKK